MGPSCDHKTLACTPGSVVMCVQVAAFTETVRRAQERGSDTVLRMACGLQDLMRGGDGEEEALERIQEFLDEFYQVRVWCESRRVFRANACNPNR